MAPTQKKAASSPTSKPKKSSWVSGCFGFGSTHKKLVADQPADELRSGNHGGQGRTGIRLLARVRFRLMKRPWSKKKGKVVEEGCGSSLKVVQVSSVDDQALPVAKVLLIDHTAVLDHKSQETKDNIGKCIDFETQAQAVKFDHRAEDNGAKCQKQPSVDKPNSIKNPPGSEEPGSQQGKPKNPTSSTRRTRARKMHRFEGDATAGMSILMVILMIMLLCGRLCAILCASIWFYCIPRLIKKPKNKNDNAQDSNSEFDSDTYRKKVVLQGFLERKHKIYVGIS